MKALSLLILAFLLSAAPGLAQTEQFRSLEHGFSLEYPREMKISIAASSATFMAPDGKGQMDVSVDTDPRILRLSLADVADALESYLEGATPLGNSTTSIGGMDALVKEYLLTDGTKTTRQKVIFIKDASRFFVLTSKASEADFETFQQLYANGIVKSFQVFAVDESLEENIEGFPRRTADKIWSSPALGDINGDGSLEVVAGSNDGKLYAWTKEGQNVPGFPFSANDRIVSSPVLADLDKDGSLDIIVGSDDGCLYVLDSRGYPLPGFPVQTSDKIVSSPAVGDIDGDGEMEIAVGSFDRGIYAWNSDGSKVCGFPLIASSTVASSPALADLNNDSQLEIVVGSKREEVELQNQIFKDYGVATSLFTGQVFAVDGRGDATEGFPLDLRMPSLRDLTGSSIGYASPAVADLNNDGQKEILFPAGKEVYALTSNGDYLRRFPVKAEGSLSDSFLGIGDLDGDGRLEIAVGANDGRLYVWRSDGTAYPGFPIQTGGFVQGLAIGDIDGDAKQEIIGGSRDNRVHAWSLDGREASGFPKITLGDVSTVPALGDLDGDGSLELAAGSDDGSLYIWRISNKFGELDWPMAMHDIGHSGAIQ